MWPENTPPGMISDGLLREQSPALTLFDARG
jgi:hypothetical protein